MPGSTPPISQLDWLISMTAMIVLFWSRATRDLLKSFGWGIGALHRLDAATKLPFPRRPPHSISRSPRRRDNRRDLPQLSAAAAFSAVAERTGLNAGCPSALFEEAAALYSLRTQRPDQNCKAVRKAWATACPRPDMSIYFVSTSFCELDPAVGNQAI